MAKYAGRLQAILGLDTKSFDKGIRDSQSRVERFGRNMRQIGARLTLATAAIATAAGAAVRSSLQSVDAQAKLAQSLGTSVESMQVLDRAAELAGVSVSGLEQLSKDLTRRLSQAAEGGGPAAKALDRLGLSATELMKMPLDQRIAQINEAIAKFVPEAERAAVAGQLFGEEGSIAAMRLDPATIARATEEIRKFGVAVTDVDAEKIERANDAMSALGLVTRGLGNRLAVALAPVLEAIAEKIAAISGWFSDLSPKMQQMVSIGAAVAAAIGPVALALGAVLTVAAPLAGALMAVVSPMGLVLGLALGAGAAFLVFRDNGSEAEKAMDAAKKAQEALNVAMADFYETGAPAAGKAAIDLANANYKLAESALAAAKAEVAKFQATLNNVRENLKAFDGKLTIDAEARLSAEEAKIERRRIQAERMLAEAEAARNRAARAVTGTMSERMTETVAKTQELKVEVTNLDKELGKVQTSGAGAGAGLGEVELGADLATQAAQRMQSQFERFRSTMQDAFTGLVTGALSFKEALGQIASSLAQMAAQSAFQELFPQMASGGKKSGSGGGILGLGGFLGFLDGGGRIGAGQFAIAGEIGPELITGPAYVTSRADTARMLRGAGSGGSVDVRISVDDGGSIVPVIERVSGDVSARVSQQALRSYDREVLPKRLGRRSVG